ncbi:MAG: hypothetical protein QXL96_06675 [Ignisphaera sp.]
MVYIKMKYSVAIKNPIHSAMRFIQLFLLLSTIAITTYGIIFRDIVAIEGGFKVAIVLLAYNAIAQSIKIVVATALSILVLLILFYSIHLYYNIIEYTLLYSMICLLILTLYNSWKQNYCRRIKIIDFEVVTLFYVVISYAWITIEEGVIWVIILTAVVIVIYKVFIPRIKVLRIFGLVNLFINIVLSLYSKIRALMGITLKKSKHVVVVNVVSKMATANKFILMFGGLSKILNILVKAYNITSLKFSRCIKGFCKQITSWSEIGKHIDYCLTNKSIALMKFMLRKFLEIENKIVERFHMISLTIERFQYIMEHNFVLLLFLASTFVLVAILVYILVAG